MHINPDFVGFKMQIVAVQWNDILTGHYIDPKNNFSNRPTTYSDEIECFMLKPMKSGKLQSLSNVASGC